MREKELEIRVLDNETLHKFHATIGDQFFGNQNQFFTSYFESPEDVFTHLTENFSQVVLENGVLRFNYTIGKKQQVKEVAVELVKEEVDDNSPCPFEDSQNEGTHYSPASTKGKPNC